MASASERLVLENLEGVLAHFPTVGKLVSGATGDQIRVNTKGSYYRNQHVATRSILDRRVGRRAPD